MSEFFQTIGSKILAGISGIVLLFSGGAQAVTDSEPTVQTAAVVATQEVASAADGNPSASSGQATTTSDVAATTTINYITQPVIERIVDRPGSGLSTEALTLLFGEFGRGLRTNFYDVVGRSVGGSIESLAESTLTLADLTDANIPDGITASNYLALAGGTLTGTLTGTDLTLSGNLTVNGAQTLSGAITIPYLSATSTTASSFIQASTTRLSVFDTAYFGGTSTTTINSIGSITLPAVALLTAPYASSTALTVSGVGYFGTASTTAFNLSGTANLQSISADSLLYNNASRELAAVSVASSLAFSSGELALNIGNGNTWTALQNFSAGASTTQFSALDALYVGRSATTTIRGDGVASTIPFASTTAVTVSGTAYFPGSGIWNASGNVGIGTTTPSAPLHVYGNSAGGPGGANIVAIFQDPSGTLGGNKWGLTTRLAENSLGISDLYSNTTPFFINSSGNVGIGTTSPWRTLSVTGTVAFSGLTGAVGAGSLCLSSSLEVVYNSASDACLSSLRETKHDIAPLGVDGIAAVLALDPVSFVYNEGDGRTRYGFIAEDTAAVDEHLTTYSASDTLSGIDDRSILSVVVRAIQELWASVKQYFAKTDALEVEVSELRFELEALKALVGPSADIAAPDVDGPSETPEATPEEPPPADESEEVVEPTPEVEKNAAEESPAPEPIVEETSTDSASSPEPEIAPETASAEE